LYWLDLGTSAAMGQIHSGAAEKRRKPQQESRLPTVAELYPEIIDSDKDDQREPACSAAEALTREEPFISQNLAYEALAMVTQLVGHGSVTYRGGFCNLRRFSLYRPHRSQH